MNKCLAILVCSWHFEFNAVLAIAHKDLKLCAYLKLGMETKNIAQLLNVTPASIRTAMYRVKKRLGVAEEINLRDYLSEVG